MAEQFSFPLAESLNELSKLIQPRFVTPLKRGSLVLELYAPHGTDPEQPHLQDELYLVRTGHGTFEVAGVSKPFTAGDALFVAAGVAHRISAFSDDFAAWVVFYGAVGGELALPPTPGADESDDPRTRNELLAYTRTAELHLMQYLDSLSERSAMDKTDPAGWNVRDHLTHLMAWEAGVTALLNKQPRAAAMGLDEPTFMSPEYDRMNEVIRLQHIHRSWNDSRWLFQQTHAEFVRTVAALAAEDVLRPYDYFVPAAAGEVKPVMGWLWGNTGAHFHEHIPWMRKITQ